MSSAPSKSTTTKVQPSTLATWSSTISNINCRPQPSSSSLRRVRYHHSPRCCCTLIACIAVLLIVSFSTSSFFGRLSHGDDHQTVTTVMTSRGASPLRHTHHYSPQNWMIFYPLPKHPKRLGEVLRNVRPLIENGEEDPGNIEVVLVDYLPPHKHTQNLHEVVHLTQRNHAKVLLNISIFTASPPQNVTVTTMNKLDITSGLAYFDAVLQALVDKPRHRTFVLIVTEEVELLEHPRRIADRCGWSEDKSHPGGSLCTIGADPRAALLVTSAGEASQRGGAFPLCVREFKQRIIGALRHAKDPWHTLRGSGQDEEGGNDVLMNDLSLHHVVVSDRVDVMITLLERLGHEAMRLPKGLHAAAVWTRVLHGIDNKNVVEPMQHVHHRQLGLEDIEIACCNINRTMTTKALVRIDTDSCTTVAGVKGQRSSAAYEEHCAAAEWKPQLNVVRIDRVQGVPSVSLDKRITRAFGGLDTTSPVLHAPLCESTRDRKSRDAVLAMIGTYSPDKIKHFVRSFVDTTATSKSLLLPMLVLFANRLTPAWEEELRRYPSGRVMIVPFELYLANVTTRHCHVSENRAEVMLHWLEHASASSSSLWCWRWLMCVDARDIVFQADPFDAMHRFSSMSTGLTSSGGKGEQSPWVGLPTERFFLAERSWRYEEVYLWNTAWIVDAFGEATLRELQSRSLYVAASPGSDASRVFSRGGGYIASSTATTTAIRDGLVVDRLPLPVLNSGMYFGNAEGIRLLLKRLVAVPAATGVCVADQGVLNGVIYGVGVTEKGDDMGRLPFDAYLVNPYYDVFTHVFRSRSELQWNVDDKKQNAHHRQHLVNCRGDTYAVVHQSDWMSEVWSELTDRYL